MEIRAEVFSLKEKFSLAQCETLGIEVFKLHTLKEYFNATSEEAYLQHAY